MSVDNFTRSAAPRFCDFPGCGKKHHGNGLCRSHCTQLLIKGQLTPIHSHRRRRGTPFVLEYDEVACPRADLKGPCHVYKGQKSQSGYGTGSVNSKTVRIHRYVWECKFGPIPKELMIDHQCRVRACCNTDHLRLVTAKVNANENCASHHPKAKTHCRKGHPYDEANTSHTKKGRVCKTCNRDWSKRSKKKAKLLSASLLRD